MVDEDITSSRTEWGLTLPNGGIAWNEFRGHPVQTAEQRWHLLKVLKQTAAEVGFDESEFLAKYGWTSRTVITTIRDTARWDIDNSKICCAAGDSDEN